MPATNPAPQTRPPRHLTVITGASRGLGLAMARARLQAGHHLLVMARQPEPALHAEAETLGAPLGSWAVDLTHPGPVAERLRAWLDSQPATAFASATLINNAALIPRIGPLRDADADDLAQALRVGLEAPMLLASAFLSATRGWSGPRRLLNISSGLGRRAMASQAGYCAVKAGMDHFSRCVALEEAADPGGARVCSLAPGVIDTDMQGLLRGADPQAFPDRTAFEQLKAQGRLSSPEQAAAAVLAFLDRPDFGVEPVADVRG